jgi:hypothetical protein
VGARIIQFCVANATIAKPGTLTPNGGSAPGYQADVGGICLVGLRRPVSQFA